MNKNIKIKSYKNKTVLYEGKFQNIQACLEDAVKNNTILAYADLTKLNLGNINLDDAQLPFADFSKSNLSGANLSESMIRGAKFNNASLYNTCFAYADIQGADFTNATFGATDITGADISFSIFSTLSSFNLDFTHARAMKDCTFLSDHGHGRNTLSRPPVIIKGLSKKPIVMLQNKILHGQRSYRYDQLFMHLGRFLDLADPSKDAIATELLN